MSVRGPNWLLRSGPVPRDSLSLRLGLQLATSAPGSMLTHNDDSPTENGDERPETVSIGELLRSTHSISHPIDAPVNDLN